MEWILIPVGILLTIFMLIQPRKVNDAVTEPPEEVKETPPEEVVLEEPIKETNREVLYRVSKKCIGQEMSPLDKAPDDLACVESLNGVFKEAFGHEIAKGLLSTTVLYKHMLLDSRFKKIPHDEIQPGDISIAVTGESTKGALHGHVGVQGKETVMGNNGSNGIWGAHYTHEAWVNVFQKKLGFPLHAFRVV